MTDSGGNGIRSRVKFCVCVENVKGVRSRTCPYVEYVSSCKTSSPPSSFFFPFQEFEMKFKIRPGKKNSTISSKVGNFI